MALPGKEALLPQNGVVRIAFVASAIPRRCGIATFTADLMAAVKAADPAVRCVAAAIDEPNTARRLWRAGVQGIITNDPGAMIRVRSEMERSAG